MTDEIQLNDNPSLETQLYMIGRAINQLSKEIVNQSERIQSNTNSVDELRFLQREQNGNVAKVTERLGILEHRQDAHDDWHGDEDIRVAQRVHQEELEKAAHRGRQEGVKSVLGVEWRIAKWLIGGGLISAGAAAGKLGNLLGVW